VNEQKSVQFALVPYPTITERGGMLPSINTADSTHLVEFGISPSTDAESLINQPLKFQTPLKNLTL